MSHPVARIFIVRHGETKENRLGIIQGQLDTELNEAGHAQVTLVAEALQRTPFDIAYTSDLVRASATAEAILKHHPNVTLYRQALLRERFMGELEGKQGRRGSYEAPSAETYEVFSTRALRWWDTTIVPLLSQASATSRSPTPSFRSILVVTHGAFIGVLVRTLSGHRNIKRPPDMRLGGVHNTSVTTIDVNADGSGALIKYADLSHIFVKGRMVDNADEVTIEKKEAKADAAAKSE